MSAKVIRTTITASNKVEMVKARQYRVLPDYYYKESDNYLAFWLALIQVAESSRTLPDTLTQCMTEIYHKAGLNCFFIGHWHQLTNNDEDQRTIRNMLQADSSGQKYKRQARNYDLLRYIDICLQYKNESYFLYVANWCQHQELCLGEEDNDLF